MEEGMVDKWCECYRAAGGVCGMLLQQNSTFKAHGRGVGVLRS